MTDLQRHRVSALSACILAEDAAAFVARLAVSPQRILPVDEARRLGMLAARHLDGAERRINYRPFVRREPKVIDGVRYLRAPITCRPMLLELLADARAHAAQHPGTALPVPARSRSAMHRRSAQNPGRRLFSEPGGEMFARLGYGRRA